ncbi:hypothetical protein NYP18_01925 [Corynebacterium sp. YIM 101645]|uniref:Uncharacterized protein n=1 Tax=Corynebacterium lemuris TaxID=1859292 RepID=A0ABT2FT65_9CORY|nr:hypothetical protein [Corynebacterium lemuris]MCS5478407.1 hypothetical protein [Corynebacterium lemuris]
MAVIFATPSTVTRIVNEHAHMSAYARAVVDKAPALTAQQSALVAAVVVGRGTGGGGHRAR